MKKYPSIADSDFQDEIMRVFPQYVIKKSKTFDEICYPKKYSLQIPQKFVAEFLNPDSPYTGLLVYHKIGAGKTCAAITIAEKFKKDKRIIVVLPASLQGGFRSELISPCANNSYITESERKQLSKFHPSSVEYSEIIDKTNKRINKVYTIYSYNKFLKLLKQGEINLNNVLLIIDEIHNLISNTGTSYKILHGNLVNIPDNSRLVLLSATPIFDKPDEIALLMNLFLKKNPMPTGSDFNDLFIDVRETNSGIEYNAKNLGIFKQYIMGYISYYRGAPPVSFPTYNPKIINVNMSKLQYRAYKKIEKQASHDDDYMSNHFLIGTRLVSNFYYPGKKLNVDGEYMMKKKDYTLENMKKYSPKYVKIFQLLKKADGPIFVYSNFKSFSGIYIFADFLDHHGYKNYATHGPGPKRYAIWSGDQKLNYRNEIKAVYNNKNNSTGDKISIMLGSPSIKEGVTLLRVQQVHLIDPHFNHSRMDQIIGRAFRFCSHKDVAEKNRVVNVYIYISVYPKLELSVEQHILAIADRKKHLNSQFELAIKESAVDCKLFKKDNIIDGDDIKCGL